MKAKIKNTLLGVSIIYSAFMICMMIFTYANMVESVNLYDAAENKTKLNEYKEIVSKMEKTPCVNAINDIITYYEDTYYDGATNIKEMYEYDDENGLLSHYSKTKTACNISEEFEKEASFPSKFLAGILYREDIYQQYFFQYELKFADIYMRDIGQAYIYATEYRVNRHNLLDIIHDLIEISGAEVAFDE